MIWLTLPAVFVVAAAILARVTWGAADQAARDADAAAAILAEAADTLAEAQRIHAKTVQLIERQTR